MALSSWLSPTTVPVPCASTYWISDGSTPVALHTCLHSKLQVNSISYAEYDETLKFRVEMLKKEKGSRLGGMLLARIELATSGL